LAGKKKVKVFIDFP